MDGKQLAKVLKRIPGGFFLSNVLMTVIYEKHHLYVEYIPITFRPRQAGKNSINMKRIIKDRKTGICGLYPSAGQDLIQEEQKDEKKIRELFPELTAAVL